MVDIDLGINTFDDNYLFLSKLDPQPQGYGYGADLKKLKQHKSFQQPLEEIDKLTLLQLNRTAPTEFSSYRQLNANYFIEVEFFSDVLSSALIPNIDEIYYRQPWFPSLSG